MGECLYGSLLLDLKAMLCTWSGPASLEEDFSGSGTFRVYTVGPSKPCDHAHPLASASLSPVILAHAKISTSGLVVFFAQDLPWVSEVQVRFLLRPGSCRTTVGRSSCPGGWAERSEDMPIRCWVLAWYSEIGRGRSRFTASTKKILIGSLPF